MEEDKMKPWQRVFFKFIFSFLIAFILSYLLSEGNEQTVTPFMAGIWIVGTILTYIIITSWEEKEHRESTNKVLINIGQFAIQMGLALLGLFLFLAITWLVIMVLGVLS